MSATTTTKPPIPNLRDLAGGSSSILRPNLILRSAAPPTVSSPELEALNISTVFDLRSALEAARPNSSGNAGNPEAPEQWPGGPRRVHVPVFEGADYGPEAVALRFRKYADSHPTEGFVTAYRDIAIAGAPAFATVLNHIASDEFDPAAQKPILVHCTAGKDRTGVLCALILSLCDIPDEVVAEEYGLTTQGMAAAKPGLIKYLVSTPAFAGDEAGAERMLSSKPEAMVATLAMIRKEWGSPEGFFLKESKVSPDTITRVRQKLIISN
ncbi:tyrosine-protein phosphatase [Trichoderma asperellum]|uniref:Tyrosine-protein phosphatase n=1 Tax=Trichoderma asperellum TaxID=101201 RepID=A0A6V8QM90_TRIAP|nr:protein-tyrosine phosphatase-like protein [Trichoderma asperelloides]GFP52916.1 tyrosine-protein phosphatase [Trichoderma asperellum]